MSGWVEQLTQWVVSLMETLGSPGAGLAVALESIFPPIPSELVLPLAGYVAAQGRLELWAVLICTTLGSLVGAGALYALGAWLGRDRLARIADKMPLVDVADLEKSEAFFDRHGGKAVLIGRVVPVVRSLISIPAGVQQMPLPRFLLLTAVGSGVWNTVLVLAGYGLGTRYQLAEQATGVLTRIVLAVLLAVLVGFVISRLRRRSKERARSTS